LDLPVPQAFMDTLSSKRVAIVGMPANDANRLAAVLERASAKPVFYEPSNVADGRNVDDCDLVVTYLQPGTAPREWRNPVAGAAGNLPMVLAGRREDLVALDPAAQRLATAILMDSWQAEEALARISLAISNPRSGRPTRQAAAPGSRMQVLIAGDDPTVLAAARTAFESYGVDYQTASDGASAVAAVRRLELDAMVLDAGIPGMDGYQVLSAIGAERLPVQVLLLATRQKPGDIVRAVALGAGDFLFKPFSPLELVARLKWLTGR
jgi:CheY-like chemotaxis protein